jgi:hypothetical protein
VAAVAKVTNLTRERLNKTFRNLRRTGAALDDELRKTAIDVARSKVRRKRRKTIEGHVAPRFMVVTPSD